MKVKLLAYRLKIRATLKQATLEQIRITKEECSRELQERARTK